MRDKQKGDLKPLLEIPQKVENFRLCRIVQCAGGFIRNQESRSADQSLGDRNPLALSRAQLVRISRVDPRIAQTNFPLGRVLLFFGNFGDSIGVRPNNFRNLIPGPHDRIQ